MPGTSCGSLTTYTASDFFVPASVRSNPEPSDSATRRAIGVLPGRMIVERQLVVPAEPPRLREMEDEMGLGIPRLGRRGEVDELAVPRGRR